MKVLIIEDEPLNAEIIAEYLSRYDAAIQIAAQLPNKEKVSAWIASHGQVDLVFCDIELLDGNVFSLLNENIIKSPIIFTTAYNSFYQEAFDVNGIAYLLKPIRYERFTQAMEKFQTLRSLNHEVDWAALSVLLQQPQKKYKERLMIKTTDGIHLLNVAQTVAILSSEGKLNAYDEKGKSHEFRAKLSDLISDLDPKCFFQINRGEIINLNFIEKIESYFGDRLSLSMKNLKIKLVTSASVTAEFRKWLG